MKFLILILTLVFVAGCATSQDSGCVGTEKGPSKFNHCQHLRNPKV